MYKYFLKKLTYFYLIIYFIKRIKKLITPKLDSSTNEINDIYEFCQKNQLVNSYSAMIFVSHEKQPCKTSEFSTSMPNMFEKPLLEIKN